MDEPRARLALLLGVPAAPAPLSNGNLFKGALAPSHFAREEIGELLEAPRHRWTEVEPAISARCWSRPSTRTSDGLGAHYTPRAYVRAPGRGDRHGAVADDWDQGTPNRRRQKARADAPRPRSGRRSTTALPDPRPRPGLRHGNFLYVALELMKRLEGEVLEALASSAGRSVLGLEGESVDPHQFLGLELNPRAAAIAELVVWIGYLQRHYRTAPASPPSQSCAPSGTSSSGEPTARTGADLGRLADLPAEVRRAESRRDLPEIRADPTGRGRVHRRESPFHLRQGLRVVGLRVYRAIVGRPPAYQPVRGLVMYWWDHAAWP